ncbi:MAG: hypothetical protein JWN77_1836 [Frankiales bacterium]|nr:hypothetical protein [Frankiales bacterium]
MQTRVRSQSCPVRRWRRVRGEDGFGLVEAVTGSFILLLFGAAVSGLLLTNMNVSKVARQRVAASQLAARELEIVRDQFAQSDASALAVVGAGSVTNPNPLMGTGASKVDGVLYTVSRTAAWAVTGTGVSACDGGGAVTYPSVRISVQVTWPKMRGVRPVTTDSIVTPSKRVLNSDYAFVAVKINTYGAKPNPGRAVTASGPGGTVTEVTDSAGCAVFGIATPGDYDFTLSEPGYVDYYGALKPVVKKTVSKGSFQTFAVTYDRAASLAVNVLTESGYGLPSPLPALVVRSGGLPSPGTRATPSTGSTTVVGDLGPYAQGYTVWAGVCPDAEPAAPPTNQTATVVTPGAGQSLDASAFLAPVAITSSLPGATVTATHASGCTGDGTLTLGVTDANGFLASSLPYGTWMISVGGGVPVSVTPTKDGATQVPA